jgi:hypothetical protein
MPVVIDELTSRFEVRNDAKLKKLVAQEVRAALEEERRRGGRAGTDPSDPSASGRPGEGG